MPAIIWFCFVFLISVYITNPLVDVDLWWHLTVGRWILAHGEVPVVDHWNRFGVGDPWRAYSWSSEVLLAWVDGRFGFEGLLVLKLALSFALTASLCWCFAKLAKDWFIGALLGAFSTLACFNHFNLRPQSLVWLLFAWLLITLVHIRSFGLDRRRVLALLLLMAVWANTHLSTALGVLLAAGWLCPVGTLRVTNRKDWWQWLTTIAVIILGTLFTPYYGAEWLTFFAKSGHPLNFNSIAEFQPAHILQYSSAFLVIGGGLLLAFIHRCPRALELPQLLTAGIFVLGGLAVVKFLPFAVILLSGLIALVWRAAEGRPDLLGNIAEGLIKLKLFVKKASIQGMAFVMLALAAVQLWRLWQEPVNQLITPVAAVDFMTDHGLRHPILNDFGRGGYLMYRLSNERGELEHKVSIDGRTNVNPPEVWKKFDAAYMGRENWREYFDLVQPRTVIWRNSSPLTTILKEDPKWCRVYRDQDQEMGYSVFVRAEDLLAYGKIWFADCESSSE